jgi:hypothetical protein
MPSAIAVVAVTLFCGPPPALPQQGGRQVEVLERWQGTSRDDNLRDQGPGRPFIVDHETWRRVWTAWRPRKDVPEINFDDDLVLVATVDGPNRLFGPVFLSRRGNVRLRLASTKVGGPGFGYLLLRVARKGIVTVNGTAIREEEDGMPAEYITVEIKGRLRTGIVAIGGETTGVTVSASNLTFELYFGENGELLKTAERLNGQTVLVSGRLEGRRGVEIPLRRIVTVESLVSASADDGSDEQQPEP